MPPRRPRPRGRRARAGRRARRTGGCRAGGGLHARRGRDRADDDRGARRRVRRRRFVDGRPPRAEGRRPDVPGDVPGARAARRAPRARGDDRGDPGQVRRRRGRGVRSILPVAHRAVRARDAELHRPQLRLAARPGVAARPARRPRAVGRAAEAVVGRGRVLRRRAAAEAVLVPVDVRRAVAVRRAGGLRRHHLHGHRGGGVLPRGRHERRRSRAGVGRLGRGSDDAVRVRRSSGSCAGRPALCGACGSPTARSSPPTPSCATPTCRWRTARWFRSSRLPRVARRGEYSPSCALWVAGVRGALPGGRRAPQHPLRRAVARGVRRAAGHGDAHARPVDPRDVALVLATRRWRPTAARRSTSSSRCRTSTGASTGRPTVRGCGRR